MRRRIGRPSRTAIVEGKWVCKSCGSENLTGSNRVCPNCGNPRDEQEDITPPNPGGPEVTDLEKLKEARSGPEWNCEHCGKANSPLEEVCEYCGAAKGTSPQRKKRWGKTQPDTPPPQTESSVVTHSVDFKPLLLLFGGVTALAILIAALYFFVFQTKEHNAIVVGHTWERSIPLEELHTYQEEGWSLPAGARLLSTQERANGSREYQIGTRTDYEDVPVEVQVGEEPCGEPRDLGNGNFEQDYCPVFETEYERRPVDVPIYATEVIYATYYFYEVDRWEVVHTFRSSGTDTSPYWPDAPTRYDQRTGQPSQRLEIIFSAEGNKKYTYQAKDEHEWKSFTQGQEVVLKVNRLGLIMDIES